ncbi:STAS domain-containing protein [Phenylobacterium sp. J426]|uniref:STAS domain-containing protein n=1 Tax=Phenylobacterium sp. J426 TaxID=2898439 RepID=UPI00215080F2|nr:STAS domain-containing protein [Phenylobacterium sp. J426]MCR5873858.1 STAS domain-containing protein [Phenylobacterium sp. J426]
MSSEPVTLAPVLDLNAAAPLAQALTERRGHPLVLDGSAVQRLGGPCLQVLLSAKATWAADGQTLTLAEPSAELTAALALMGAAQSFSGEAPTQTSETSR